MKKLSAQFFQAAGAVAELVVQRDWPEPELSEKAWALTDLLESLETTATIWRWCLDRPEPEPSQGLLTHAQIRAKLWSVCRIREQLLDELQHLNEQRQRHDQIARLE